MWYDAYVPASAAEFQRNIHFQVTRKQRLSRALLLEFDGYLFRSGGLDKLVDGPEPVVDVQGALENGVQAGILEVQVPGMTACAMTVLGVGICGIARRSAQVVLEEGHGSGLGRVGQDLGTDAADGVVVNVDRRPGVDPYQMSGLGVMDRG